jgi:hypothetical protein
MDYLTETAPIYTRESNGWVSMFQHDEVMWDEYNGLYYDIHGNHEVSPTLDRPAKWWCVAVYETDRRYGGPEEGGWWYTAGELVEHDKIRFFDNYKNAYDYIREMWAWCFEQNKDRGDLRLAVRAFTEQLPDTHFPKTRPYYS